MLLSRTLILFALAMSVYAAPISGTYSWDYNNDRSGPSTFWKFTLTDGTYAINLNLASFTVFSSPEITGPTTSPLTLLNLGPESGQILVNLQNGTSVGGGFTVNGAGTVTINYTRSGGSISNFCQGPLAALNCNQTLGGGTFVVTSGTVNIPLSGGGSWMQSFGGTGAYSSSRSSLFVSGGTVNVSFTEAPEPSRSALMVLAVAGLPLWRHIRRRS